MIKPANTTASFEKRRADVLWAIWCLLGVPEKPSADDPVFSSMFKVAHKLVQVSNHGDDKHGTDWVHRSHTHHHTHLREHTDSSFLAGIDRNRLDKPSPLRSEQESGLPHSIHAALRALMSAVRDEMEEKEARSE